MCISVFYAQVFGLWLFILGLAMFLNQGRMKRVMSESLTHSALLLFVGICVLMLGLFIVVSHNIWVPAWPVLITLLGWFFLLQGIVRIFWPESFVKHAKDMINSSGFTIVTWVWLLVGAYLTWAGFFS